MTQIAPRMSAAQRASILKQQLASWERTLERARKGNPFATLCMHCDGRHSPPNNEICPFDPLPHAALQAIRTTIYRDLNPQQQLECFIAGSLTGIIGVCFASIQDEGRDAIMDYLTSCLPQAREQAESIIAEAWPQ